jgi:fumarylacetoacetate (FAA) hydrolase
MKLGTLRNGRPDGQLIVVASRLDRYVSAGRIAPNLQAALDDWEIVRPGLEQLSAALNTGSITGQPFDPALAMAPLPRAFQWIDGAGYLSHLERIRSHVEGEINDPQPPRPLLYRGACDHLAGPMDPITIAEDDLSLDFEAEIAVVLGPVRMRPSRAEATAAIRLVALCNDLSMR